MCMIEYKNLNSNRTLYLGVEYDLKKFFRQ